MCFKILWWEEKKSCNYCFQFSKNRSFSWKSHTFSLLLLVKTWKNVIEFSFGKFWFEKDTNDFGRNAICKVKITTATATRRNLKKKGKLPLPRCAAMAQTIIHPLPLCDVENNQRCCTATATAAAPPWTSLLRISTQRCRWAAPTLTAKSTIVAFELNFCKVHLTLVAD